MDNNLLIDNIRKLCKKHNVSISKLESDLYLSPGLISRWNKSMPALDKITDIADYFGVSIDTLIGRCENNIDHTNISRFLILLYNRSLEAEINWEIFNFQNPPEDLKYFSSKKFLSNSLFDCYYASYMNGFFFLTVAYNPNDDLQLTLFTLPDTHSQLECISSDTERLMQLYEYLNRRFSKQLNKMKSANLINAFLQETLSEELSTEGKVTSMRNINDVSNF